ncbi:PKD domain-containing protein [Kitasatospora sp. LaBMicrA B282]|uniref:PKD domain-containing protein n=1 Tax=Kitasatospora sp. LaBMicrA B282 TaxID=3420949 RepID=UPI003D0BDAEE
MPRRRNIGLAAAIVSSTILGTALPAFVAHADSATLYVNNAAPHCSDSGGGTQAQPFCTVQAAADVAQPGQTVLLAPSTSYPEQVTVTHSGTPGHPITFKGAATAAQASAWVGGNAGVANAPALPHAFVLSGVHDVTISGLFFETPQEAVLVSDSSRIVLDSNMLEDAGKAAAGTSGSPSIRLTGKTSDARISRNRFVSVGSVGVSVDAGVTGAVVTTNEVRAGQQSGGVVVTDAPGTVVTSNTIAVDCQSGITLAGASAGSTIENNVVVTNDKTTCQGQPDLVVSGGSTTGTKVDYNVVRVLTGVTPYAWGSGSFGSPSQFAAATGQGGHDVAENDPVEPTTETAGTDSADATAPGELDTDIDGNPRVDDPLAPNTGTGPGYVDRGAIELQNPLAITELEAQADSTQPLAAVVRWSVRAPWSQATGTRLTGTLDFGDGSPKLDPASHPDSWVEHTYPAPGTYTVTFTVIDPTGVTRTQTTTATIPDASPIIPSWGWEEDDSNAPTVKFTDASTSPWPVAKYSFDFGDGQSASFDGPGRPAPFTHAYATTGQYTVTETVTDDHGRSAASSRTLTVSVQATPERVIEAVEGGVLHEIYNDPAGVLHDGVVTSGAGTVGPIGFATGPAGQRVIEAVEGGVLHEIYSAADGWHDNPIDGAGPNISALAFSYSPTGARVIEAIENGRLHEIYSAADGWHDNPVDGVAPNVYAMSFSYNLSGARVIEANEGGVLHEIYSAADGWHDNPIDGVGGNISTLSFSYNQEHQRVIEAVESGQLHEIYSDSTGWHDGVVPAAALGINNLSVKVSATDDRIIEAVENGTIHEVHTDQSSWTDSALPIAATDVSYIALQLRY